MLFYKFHSQEERKKLFGGDCVELAYCRLPRGTDEETVLHDFACWSDDSLYIDSSEEEDFFAFYDGIFTGRNGTKEIDWFGLCWFSPEETARIMEQVRKEKPMDWEILLPWLEAGKAYNGFYFLGI